MKSACLLSSKHATLGLIFLKLCFAQGSVLWKSRLFHKVCHLPGQEGKSNQGRRKEWQEVLAAQCWLRVLRGQWRGYYLPEVAKEQNQDRLQSRDRQGTNVSNTQKRSESITKPRKPSHRHKTPLSRWIPKSQGALNPAQEKQEGHTKQICKRAHFALQLVQGEADSSRRGSKLQ